MNTTNNNSNTTTEIRVKRKYVRKIPPAPKGKLIIKDEDDSDSEPEPEPEPVVVVPVESVLEEKDEDDKSSISTILMEDDESDSEASADKESEKESEDETPLPKLESDPIVLRATIADLQAEVIRLTKFNQDLQRRLEGQRKQPKTKAEKKQKEATEGKRKIQRPKRPVDYAQRYMKQGQVLVWKHTKRNCQAKATYIGGGLFSAEYSWTDEKDSALTLHSISLKMTKHMSVHGVNAWAVFKNEDGSSVENLDLQKA